jgi:tetratricopeptide (TPR) repeat protein
VARHLLDAIAEAERDEFRKAERYLETAHNLAPEYYEVYRVRAFVNSKQRNYPGARDAYEAAVDLEPSYAPLRFAYARFAMIGLGDLESATAQLKEGLRVDPDSPELQLELAKVYLYTHNFELARSILVNLRARIAQMTRWNQQTITYDLYLQYFARAAEDQVNTGGAPEALKLLAEMIKEFSGFPESAIDERMLSRLSKTVPTAEKCLVELQGGALEREAKEVIEQLHRFNTKRKPVADPNEYSGVVQRILPYKDFGFLSLDNGAEYFFHRKSLRQSQDWSRLKPGVKVTFRLGVNKTGPCAVNVALDILA